MKILNYAFYIWVIIIVAVLSIKSFTWEVKESVYKERTKVNVCLYNKIENVNKTGYLFDKPRDSVIYNKRRWFTYCPAIHKKPKQWGKYLR